MLANVLTLNFIWSKIPVLFVPRIEQLLPGVAVGVTFAYGTIFLETYNIRQVNNETREKSHHIVYGSPGHLQAHTIQEKPA